MKFIAADHIYHSKLVSVNSSRYSRGLVTINIQLACFLETRGPRISLPRDQLSIHISL